MLASDVLGYASDVEKAQRRMDALEALLRMRSKQLQESLKERIKRAHTHGEWIQLSSEECRHRSAHAQRCPSLDLAAYRYEA